MSKMDRMSWCPARVRFQVGSLQLALIMTLQRHAAIVLQISPTKTIRILNYSYFRFLFFFLDSKASKNESSIIDVVTHLPVQWMACSPARPLAVLSNWMTGAGGTEWIRWGSKRQNHADWITMATALTNIVRQKDGSRAANQALSGFCLHHCGVKVSKADNVSLSGKGDSTKQDEGKLGQFR